MFYLIAWEDIDREANLRWLRETNAWVHWLRKLPDQGEVWESHMAEARFAQARAAGLYGTCDHHFVKNEAGDPVCTRCFLFSILGYNIQEGQ